MILWGILLRRFSANNKDTIENRQDQYEYHEFYQHVCYGYGFSFDDRFDNHYDSSHDYRLNNRNLGHSLLFV